MIRLTLPIEDDDLRIRAWDSADLAAYFALRSDPDVARYVGDAPEEMFRAEALLATDIGLTAARSVARLAIEGGNDGIIGLLSLQQIRSNADPRWELVIGIARSHRGKRRGSRAVALVLDTMFVSNPDIDAVYGRREFGNAESRGVMRRIGMRAVGTIPSTKNDAPCPDRLYVLPRSEWRGV